MKPYPFLAVFFALIGFIAYPLTARAVDTNAAKQFIEETAQELLKVIATDTGTQEKEDKFREVILSRCAMPQISRFVIGAKWREMNDDQKARYQTLFTKYIAHSYTGKLAGYNGETVTIKTATDTGARGIVVLSQVNRINTSPITVEWLVNQHNDKIVIADIVIEGVSLLITQQAEFKAALERADGSIDALLDELKKNIDTPAQPTKG